LFESVQSWHSLQVDDVANKLGTSSSGLTTLEARNRLQDSGPNKLRSHRQTGAFRLFLRQLQNPLIYVLLAATLLSVGMGKVTDGLVILSVVVINTVIGFVQ
jgi:magnesium-transporting ATPase (P-type)